MRPQEWIKGMLQRRGLDKPDGRPLYQYRLTDQEFEELQSLLKLSSHLGFQHVSILLLNWNAALVMYASEWWRRFYAGQWSWDGIFNSLGIDISDVSTARRNEVIQTGLNGWQRIIRKVGGRRHFLGTVATEGGLPLARLKDAGGWLNNVLRPVLRRHISRGVDIGTLLEAYSDAIPQSYQSQEILQILEDLIGCIADLRSRHNFSTQNDPVTWLDEQEPKWREVFPLPIESEIATSLLTDLIQEAAKTKAYDAQSDEALFQLDRFLVNETLHPAVKAKLEAPSFIPVAFFEQLGMKSSAAKFDFEICNDLGERWLWCRGFKTVRQDQSVFKLTGKPLLFEGARALAELSLRIKVDGEILGTLPVMSAQKLIPDEPWIFVNVAGRWELHGTATQKTKHEEAIVYIPKEMEIKLKDEASLLTLGSAYDGKFYLLSGTVTCGNHSDDSFYVLATKTQDSFIQYELEGNLYNGTSSPGKVFIGLPRLLERNMHTGYLNKKPINSVRVKLVGEDGAWKPLVGDLIGVYELRLFDDSGAMLCKRRVGLLPESFNIKLEADKRNARAGKVFLEGLPQVGIRSVNSDCKSHQSYSEQLKEYCFSLESEGVPPHSIFLEILPPNQRKEITLQVPFPCKGAILYDPKGKATSKRHHQNLNDLHGYRIKIFNDRVMTANSAQLRFSLNDSTLDPSELRNLYINKEIKLKKTITEISLIEWFDVLQEMLGVSASLDSSVHMTLVLHGSEMLAIKVYRYNFGLKPDWSEGTLALDDGVAANLSLEQLSNIKLDSVLLNQPEQRATEIVPIQSEGVDLGAWDIQLYKRKPGLWLVYPAVDSAFYFRPLLWVVWSEDESSGSFNAREIGSLQQAVLLENYIEREAALRIVLRSMAMDVNHNGWKYLEILNERCGHLPLATFDIWRVAVSEPSFLALLIVKEPFESVIDRFESELPVLWELVHIKDWEQALKAYRSDLIQTMCVGDELVDQAIHLVIKEMVLKVIQRIEGLGASMQCICTLLKHSVLNLKTKELQILQMPFDFFVKGDLEHSFQEMINRNSDADWPIMLQQRIGEKFNMLPNELKVVIKPHLGFQRAVSYLPAVLAARLFDDNDSAWLGSAVNIFKLDQLKEFDLQWFSSAFQTISGWMYFQGQDN
ncbi:MAG: hypothetical protein H7A00_03350 [Hahellaceae bacterium]|nr:hypothetical protein [Hahellaceae bacterium]